MFNKHFVNLSSFDAICIHKIGSSNLAFFKIFCCPVSVFKMCPSNISFFITGIICITKIVTSFTIFLPNIHYLLANVPYCDVGIVYYGLQSINFQPSCYPPTALVNFKISPVSLLSLRPSQYDLNNTFVSDIYKVRLAPCRITFLYGNLDRKSEDQQRSFWVSLILQSPFRFWDNDRWETIKTGINYILLISNCKNYLKQMLTDFRRSSIKFVAFAGIHGDSGIPRIWRYPAVAGVEVMRTNFCLLVGGEDNLVSIFQTHSQPPKVWILDTTNTDISTSGDPHTFRNNPFDRLSKESVDLHLARYVLFKTNATLAQRDYLGSSSSILIDHISGPYQTVVTEFRGWEFLTCYKKTSTTFDFYMTPFQPEIWYALLSTLFFLVMVISVYLKVENIKSFLCSSMAVIALVFEEGMYLPAEVERKKFIRTVLGSWLLMSVFLTNCYNGIMIDEFNSPFPSIKIKTFRDLVCDYKKVKYSSEGFNNLSRNSKESFSHLDYVLLDSYYDDVLKFVLHGELVMREVSDPCFSLLSTKAKLG